MIGFFMRPWFCEHQFYLDQLGTRDDAGMLHVPCFRCGKVCTADCGLHLPGSLKGYSPEYEAARQQLNGEASRP